MKDMKGLEASKAPRTGPERQLQNDHKVSGFRISAPISTPEPFNHLLLLLHFFCPSVLHAFLQAVGNACPPTEPRAATEASMPWIRLALRSSALLFRL